MMNEENGRVGEGSPSMETLALKQHSEINPTHLGMNPRLPFITKT